jgi:hypothetical protein
MKVGTKSVLYGVHAFWLHPFFVALAWWKLYGFPWDLRLWVAFFVHDLGYVGKPNMDGEEGELHPILGARIMTALFDRNLSIPRRWFDFGNGLAPIWLGRWGQFCLLHSRYFAKRHHAQPSRLCIADKLAIALTPAWLYLPMARATGEIREYMAHAHHRAAGNEALSEAERAAVTSGQERDWYAGVQAYMRRWVDEHRDGKVDTWTATESKRAALGPDGVWR